MSRWALHHSRMVFVRSRSLLPHLHEDPRAVTILDHAFLARATASSLGRINVQAMY
jgi:hypothetical protein